MHWYEKMHLYKYFPLGEYFLQKRVPLEWLGWKYYFPQIGERGNHEITTSKSDVQGGESTQCGMAADGAAVTVVLGYCTEMDMALVKSEQDSYSPGQNIMNA